VGIWIGLGLGYQFWDTRKSFIAKMVNVSPQKLQYHFSKHVIGKGLIEGFAVLLPYFDEVSDIFCFRFDFDNGKDMAKFALSLQAKPFARGIGKIFGENALFVQIYLPRKEFGGFTDSLSRLIKNGLLRSYDYVIEDPSRVPKQQTISHQFFENNTWIYNHEKHMEDLRNLVKNVKLQH